MSIPGAASPLFIGAAAAAEAGYQIDRSLRFNSGDSAYLSRADSNSNQRTVTISFWIKKLGTQGEWPTIFSSTLDGNNGFTIRWNQDRLQLYVLSGGNYGIQLTPSRKFRDYAGWLHVVCKVDTTASTASDRAKFYFNGVEHTSGFDFTTSYPSQNEDLKINVTGQTINIGRLNYNASRYIDAYLADFYFIDGSALDPTSFGAYDDNGVWQAAAYSGTFGTNGFHLDFADNSSNAALGNDAAGSNNWTVNNISADDGAAVTTSAATGALPIHNTTDDFGVTKGSGYRTDANASSLVLAIPFDTVAASGSASDVHADIKGSGTNKVSYHNIATDSNDYYFYGSAAFFDGSQNDSVTHVASSDFDFGTGDFTIELWCRPSSTSGDQYILSWTNPTGGTRPDAAHCGFNIYNGSWKLGGFNNYLYTGSFGLVANAWTHLAMSRSGNNLRMFVNGTLVQTRDVTGVTFDDSSGITLGRYAGSSAYYYTGYIQDLRVYKGVGKYTTSFSVPAPANPTVGAACDSLLDSPTNGTQSDTGAGGEVSGCYAVWNALGPGGTSTYGTLSNGNLDASLPASGKSLFQTIFPESGKWYVEIKFVSGGGAGGGLRIGVINENNIGKDLGSTADSWAYLADGRVYHNGSAPSYGVSSSVGDLLMIALDIDAGKLWYGKNGSWMASGDPANGNNPSQSFTAGQKMSFSVQSGSGTVQVVNANWGQREWLYNAPSGFKAVCTANLPTPTIADGSAHFQANLWSGTGSSRSITTTGMGPDFVWYKQRNSSSYGHDLFDSVRGPNNILNTNNTLAQYTEANRLTAFNADGFSLGNSAPTNGSSGTYVGWAWNAGSSTVSNTDGSVTSSVRANQTAGFSIVTYTGNSNSSKTIGHGLNAAPEMIIIKCRNATSDWTVFHKSTGNNAFCRLNLTNSSDLGGTGVMGATSPTSSVFTVGDYSGTGDASRNFVAYCFAPVAGFSAFGSYTGNGSTTNGPFAYTGFRPAFLLIKRSNSSDNWAIYDTARDPENRAESLLRPNTSGAEDSSDIYNRLDILSNGFKIRPDNATYGLNVNGGEFIYAAFAENPFQANGGLAR